MIRIRAWPTREALRGAVLDAWAVLMPISCAGCGADDRALCPACVIELVAHPLHAALADGTALVTALRYEGSVRRTILAYKEQGRTDVAGALAAPLAAAIGSALILANGTVQLCAVPASRAAFRRRGYDPVALLLRRAGVPPPARVLVPTRQHAKQKTLDRAARELNLAGWLRARHPLSGQKFIVVDDVVTTGATLAEAVRAIRDGGGEVISAVALASTPRLFGDFSRIPSKLVTSPDDGTTVSKRGAE